MKAGKYCFNEGTTPERLLEQIASGETLRYSIAMVEGWYFRQLMDAVHSNEYLPHTLSVYSDEEIMAHIVSDSRFPEIAGRLMQRYSRSSFLRSSDQAATPACSENQGTLPSAKGMGLRAGNLQTRVMITATSWGSYLGEENMKNGIRVCTSSYTRQRVNVTMCKANSNGNYINSILPLNEALA